MPSKEALPEGPRRDFVAELFLHYKEANRPTLRRIADWIAANDNLSGSPSYETIRKVLGGRTVPRRWEGVEAILLAFCAISGRHPGEDRFPDADPYWDTPETFASQLKKRWDAALDDDPEAERLPAPRPPAVPTSPAASSQFSDDPWVTSASTRTANFNDEPPF